MDETKLLQDQTFVAKDMFNSVAPTPQKDDLPNFNFQNAKNLNPISPIKAHNSDLKTIPNLSQKISSPIKTSDKNVRIQTFQSSRANSNLPKIDMPGAPTHSKVDPGALSLIESVKLRRKRQQVKRDWNKIFTESNLRLIQVLKSRKKQAIKPHLGWKVAKEIDEYDRLMTPLPKSLKKNKGSKSLCNLKGLNQELSVKTVETQRNEPEENSFKFSKQHSMSNLKGSEYDRFEKRKCKEILKMLETKSLESKIYFNNLKQKEELKKFRMLNEDNMPKKKTFAQRFVEYSGNIDPIAERFIKNRKNSKSAKLMKMPRMKIPRLIGAGRRREFGSVSKARTDREAESKIVDGGEEAELMKVMDVGMNKPSFIEKMMKTLRYRPAEHIKADWKMREKLLEYEKVRTEVLTLNQWKREHKSGQIYLR